MNLLRQCPRMTAQTKRAARPTRLGGAGYALLEALVYIGLVITLLGVGYAALYRCIDNSVALRRSADDVVRTLHLGERWRADIRAASGGVRLENGPGQETLYLSGTRGTITYRFADGRVFRRLGEGPWVRVLSDIQASTMRADARGEVRAWRWELELQPQTKGIVKAGRIRPLFTFLAVPENGSATAQTTPESDTPLALARLAANP